MRKGSRQSVVSGCYESTADSVCGHTNTREFGDKHHLAKIGGIVSENWLLAVV